MGNICEEICPGSDLQESNSGLIFDIRDEVNFCKDLKAYYNNYLLSNFSAEFESKGRQDDETDDDNSKVVQLYKVKDYLEVQ